MTNLPFETEHTGIDSRSERPDYSLQPGKYGIVSDLHIGSPFFDEVAFSSYVNLLVTSGVDTIISAGDNFDYNDLHHGRVTSDEYLGTVDRVMDLLRRNQIKMISCKGNHEESLESEEPEMHTTLQEKSIGVLAFPLPDRSRVRIGSVDFLLVHDGEQETNESPLEFTIKGHTHVGVIQDRIINPGSFRRHFQESVPIGGILMSVSDSGAVILERLGEYNEAEQKLVSELEGFGFFPRPFELPEDSDNYELYKEIRNLIADCDPDCVVWFTGSTAQNTRDTTIGRLNPRYKILYDQSGLPIRIEEDRTDAPQLYGEMSDIDVEVISATLTKATLKQLLQQILTNTNYYTPTRLEVCCYSPKEVDSYFNVGDQYITHNYFLYRLLYSSKAILSKSDQELLSRYCRKGLAYLEAVWRRNDYDLSTLPTTSTATGYAEFKKVKHLLRRGELEPTKIDPQTGIYDYLAMKTSQIGQVHPPYIRVGAESFKAVAPDFNRNDLIIDQTDRADTIIAPPLTLYDGRIHFGQLINIFSAAVVARLHGAQFNPLTFQATGPYWDSQKLSPEDIRNNVMRNQASVVSMLSNHGLDGAPITDFDERAVNAIRQIIDSWVSLGLIARTEKGPRYRVGAALTLFGGMSLLTSNNLQSLSATIEKYQADQMEIPLYPLSTNSDGQFMIEHQGVPLYPSFTVLPLPYIDDKGAILKQGSVRIICGENIATQFALTHGVIAHQLRAAEVHFQGIKLISDETGKRMTRKTGTLPYFDDLLGDLERERVHFTKSKEYNTRDAYSDEKYSPYALTYGLLSMVSTTKSRKFNTQYFRDGFNCLFRLRGVWRQYQKTLMGGSNNYHRDWDKQYPDDFIGAVQQGELGKAVRIYFNSVVGLSKKKYDTREQFNQSDIHMIMSMTYVLFGESGILSVIEA